MHYFLRRFCAVLCQITLVKNCSLRMYGDYGTRLEVGIPDFLASSFYMSYPNSPSLSVPDGRFPGGVRCASSSQKPLLWGHTCNANPQGVAILHSKQLKSTDKLNLATQNYTAINTDGLCL